MTDIGIADAKAQLSELIERAAAGEDITITKHGKPMVRLVSVEPGRLTPAEAVARLREIRKGVTLGGLSIRALRDQGRP
jgi:prevent-host-death family protein